MPKRQKSFEYHSFLNIARSLHREHNVQDPWDEVEKKLSRAFHEAQRLLDGGPEEILQEELLEAFREYREAYEKASGIAGAAEWEEFQAEEFAEESNRSVGTDPLEVVQDIAEAARAREFAVGALEHADEIQHKARQQTNDKLRESVRKFLTERWFRG